MMDDKERAITKIDSKPSSLPNNNTKQNKSQVDYSTSSIGDIFSDESLRKLEWSRSMTVDSDGNTGSMMVKPFVVVGYDALRKYLRPKHEYFDDKPGVIEDWVAYRCEKDSINFVYPRLCRMLTHPLNPYRLLRKANQTATKSLRLLGELVSACGIESPQLLSFVFTFPGELSERLQEHPKGEEVAWGAWRKFYKRLTQFYLNRAGVAGKFGGRAALHIWGSSYPFDAHYHFHFIALNQLLSLKADQFVEMSPYLKPEELKEIKKLWSTSVIELATDLEVNVPLCLESGKDKDGEDKQKLANLHFTYFPLENKPKAVHAFKYINRSPILDYADYTFDHPDCPPPPEWLEGYKNTVRAYGWFRSITMLLIEKGITILKDFSVVCPLSRCDDILVEKDRFSLTRSARAPPPMIALLWRSGRPHLVDVDYLFLVECEDYPLVSEV